MKPTTEPTILAIDTSCDDTSAAVTQGRRVLSNIVSSQEQLHKKYGGVMPSLAKLEHAKRIKPVVSEALKRSRVELAEIDAIAVTQGPGLAISLEVGLNYAKQIAIEHEIPLIPINHMEGHLLSSLAQNSKGNGSSITEDYDPASWLGFLISGGHTELIKVVGLGDYKKIGETLDDACGEAFDKTARVLGFGYPGGKVLASMADEVRSKFDIYNYDDGRTIRIGLQLGTTKLELPIPMSKDDSLSMSFSGLKTAFWQLVRSLTTDESGNEPDAFRDQRLLGAGLDKETTMALAVLFETAASRHLEQKLGKALGSGDYQHVLLGGGVVNNVYIRRQLRKVAARHGAKLHIPFHERLFVDNAAMIGIAAAHHIQKNSVLVKTEDINAIDRMPTWSIEELNRQFAS